MLLNRFDQKIPIDHITIKPTICLYYLPEVNFVFFFNQGSFSGSAHTHTHLTRHTQHSTQSAQSISPYNINGFWCVSFWSCCLLRACWFCCCVFTMNQHDDGCENSLGMTIIWGRRRIYYFMLYDMIEWDYL